MSKKTKEEKLNILHDRLAEIKEKSTEKKETGNLNGLVSSGRPKVLGVKIKFISLICAGWFFQSSSSC